MADNGSNEIRGQKYWCNWRKICKQIIGVNIWLENNIRIELYNDRIYDKKTMWFGNYLVKGLYNKGII